MPQHILIIDPVAAKPYTVDTLRREPLGGTESTILRVGRALSARHHIMLAQSARNEPSADGYGIRYRPYAFKSPRPVMDSQPPDTVIVVRAYKTLLRIRRQYPGARLFLWLHCFPGKHGKRLNEVCLETDTTIITVSDTHKEAVEKFIRKYQEHGNYDRKMARVTRIYNPVNDDLKPDGRGYDPDKLVYFSSPHKGLPQVLETFAYVRQFMPGLRLYVANPGYMRMKSFPQREGVINLGALPHDQVIGHVREAFCVFYPQSRFRETFGLVFAEANAVGTPVIAHRIGSTPEIIGHPGQLVDAECKEEVLKTII
ncbi:MAG: glycosyltransferase family 4 protein, partial [Balneolales bacterium]